MTIYMITFIVYLVAMMAIGFLFKGQASKSTSSFFVANRGLGFIVMVGTLVGTALGGGVTLGTVGMAYNGGFYCWTLSLAGALGYLALAFLAGKLYKTQAITTPDILAARFGKAGRFLSSIFNLLFNVVVVAGQIIAMGTVIQFVLGVNFVTGMIITTIVFVVYTMFGGMYAVAYTDVVQSVFIIGGLLYILIFVLTQVGGFGNAVSILKATTDASYFSFTAPGADFLSSYFLYTIFGIVTMQVAHQRIFAASSEATAKKSTFTLFFIIVITYIIPPIIGMVGRVLMPGLDNPQNTIPLLVRDMMPPVAGAFVFLALMSVMMSTADSTLLSLASNIVQDFYVPLSGKSEDEIGEKKIVLISRIVMIVMAAIGLLVAVNNTLLMPLQVFRLTVLASAMTVPLLAALFWKRATKLAGILSMALGGFGCMIWEALGSPAGIASIYVGLALSLIAMVAVSYAQKPEIAMIPSWMNEK